MAELYDMTAGVSITNIVESCEEEREVNQVLNYARDGTIHLQIIGSPRIKYRLICYATRSQKTLLDTAWAAGNQLRITMAAPAGSSQARVMYGRIIEFDPELMANMWDGVTRQDYYKTTITLINAPEESTPSSSS